MPKNNKIQTFLVEEHHEAFYVWNYAILNNLIPASGNCLFHIDEHSDMTSPRFNWSINEIDGDLNKIKEFTYRELNIGSFIIPAVYKEIIKSIYWIRQKHRSTKKKSAKLFVRSYNRGGKCLLRGNIKDIKDGQLSTFVEDTDMKEFDYYLRTIDQIPSNRKVILDIDLDFFSCSGDPNQLEEIYIEIAEQEYSDYINNRYHRLNYSNIGKIDTMEAKGRYFYVINNFDEVYPSDVKVNENSIDQRTEAFVSLLEEKKVFPTLIDICRSRHSGFTPKDQWEYIESNLLKKLSKIYNTELITINDL